MPNVESIHSFVSTLLTFISPWLTSEELPDASISSAITNSFSPNLSTVFNPKFSMSKLRNIKVQPQIGHSKVAHDKSWKNSRTWVLGIFHMSILGWGWVWRAFLLSLGKKLKLLQFLESCMGRNLVFQLSLGAFLVACMQLY